MKRSLIVVLTMAMLLFAFAGVAAASEQEDAADRLFDFGVIEGFPDGSLGLDREITRAEFAKIAVVAKGLEDAAELLQSSSSQFSDVATSVWYTGWVNVANAQEIVIGYPDGTFRPNDNISVAEAVSMILRTLGYNDNLPGAWPTNYLVKGSDLGITTGLVSNANVNAVRGDVFAMLNRALDEDVVAWETEIRGSDAADFRSKGYTLLQEMLNAKDETEGWVVDNFRTDDSLEANEIRIAEELGDGGRVYELMSNDDVDWLLGLEVDVKHNSDDEIAYVEVKTSDSNIIFDLVSNDDVDRDVELQVKDREYDYDEEAVLFVNFDQENELAEGQYGKFVLKNGRIATAVAFESKDIGVVSEIDGDVYEFVYNGTEDEDAEEGDFDFSDYDDVVVFNTKLTVFDGDIEVYDVVYTFEAELDGDDILYVVVSDAKVEGELERLRDDANRLIVDGSTYRSAEYAVYTLNEGEDYAGWGEGVEDLIGEDVLLSRDFIGYIMLATGDSAATSGTRYGVVTWIDEFARNPIITLYTDEDVEVEYGFDTRADATEITWDYDFQGIDVVLAEFKLNRDGDIADGEFAIYDEEEDLYTIEKTADRRTVTVSGGVYDGETVYISSSTKFFTAIDDGDLDPAVIEYDDIYRTSFTSEDVVMHLTGNMEAKAIVFISDDFVAAGDDDFYGVVTSRPWQDSNEWYTDIDVYGEGENEYILDSRTGFDNESLVQFRITSGDRARAVANASETATVTKRDGSFLTVSGDVYGTYRVASGAVLYEDGDKIRLSQINADDEIEFLLNKDNEIVAAIVTRDGVAADTGGTDDDTVNAGDVTAGTIDGNIVVTIDGDSYNYVGALTVSEINALTGDLEITYGTVREETVITSIEELED